MKTIVLILFLIPTMVLSQIPQDKRKHFVAGAYFGGGTSMIVYDQTGNYKKAFVYGVLSSITVGLAKELYDQHKYGGFDNKDLLATILGGVTINIPLYFYEKRHKKRKQRRYELINSNSNSNSFSNNWNTIQ